MDKTETPKEYILRKHKRSVVMHEVLSNNFHPFIHLERVYKIMEEYNNELKNKRNGRNALRKK